MIKISVVEFSEDSNQLDIVSVYEHEDQVWALETSPDDDELLVTSSLSTSGSKNVVLWKLNKSEESNSRDLQPLLQVASFRQRDASVFVNCIKWHHTKAQLLMTDPIFLTIWSFTESATEVVGNLDLTRGASQVSKSDWVGGAASWDPHATGSCAIATVTRNYNPEFKK